MTNVLETAKAFFDACETGKGWAVCQTYCWPDATFQTQAEPLVEVRTLEAYTNWMQGLLTFIPDGRYEMKAFAADPAGVQVTAFATFHGTHTGQGGPCPPTGRKTVSDYVYVMAFEGGRIRSMTKIWNAGWAMRELGWC
jgi:predicted ester cyclase